MNKAVYVGAGHLFIDKVFFVLDKLHCLKASNFLEDNLHPLLALKQTH